MNNIEDTMENSERIKKYGSITEAFLVVNKNKYSINKHTLRYICVYSGMLFFIFGLLAWANFFVNRDTDAVHSMSFSENFNGNSGANGNSGTNGNSGANGNSGTNDKKPNFVVIVADDLGWDSIGYSDDSMTFVTPYLTSLAQNGIIMENFYAQEVCSPSRGSLLTGRYPLSIGMQYGMVSANAEWGMPLDETTLAEVLQDSGYSTHMLGKWHLGYFSPKFLPTARGFDNWTGYANGENYYWSKKNPDYPENVDFITSDKSCYQVYDGEDIHNYSTTFYTNKAINIIETHDTSVPLFLYLAYQAVHEPRMNHSSIY